MEEKKQAQMFSVIVGSQAHGLATPESDFDYRGVFLVPTVDILKLGGTAKTTSWIEGKDDDTSYELAHFLHLAAHSNPNVLDVFMAPMHEVLPGFEEDTERLLALFPHLWSSKGVRDAFVGYSHNQRKKLMDKKDDRPHKYASAYLRVLYNAKELLETGKYTIRIIDTPIGEFVKRVKMKDPDISLGEIINKCEELEAGVHEAFAKNPNKETDIEKVNDFLLEMRLKHYRF